MTAYFIIFCIFGVLKSPMGLIQKHYQQHEYAEVVHLVNEFDLQKLPIEDAQSAQVFKIFSLLNLERFNALESAFIELEQLNTSLGPYGDYLRIRLATKLKQCDDAKNIAQQLPSQSRFNALSWEAISRCYIQEHNTDSLKSALNQLDNAARFDTHEAEALFLRSELATLEHKPYEALPFLRNILVHYATTPAAREAENKIQRLAKQGIRFSPLQPHEIFPRAEQYKNRSQKKKARESYQSLLQYSLRYRLTEYENQAHLGLTELDIVDQHYPLALQRVARILNNTQSRKFMARALFLQGDILTRQGKVGAAIRSYETVVERFEHDLYAPISAYAAARLYYITNKFNEAKKLASLARLHERSHDAVSFVSEEGVDGNKGEVHDLASFLMGWIEHQQNNNERMNTIFKSISETSSMAPSALYWRAKYELEQQNIEEAMVLCDKLIQIAPTLPHSLTLAKQIHKQNPSYRHDFIQKGTSEALVGIATPATEAIDMQGAMLLLRSHLYTEAKTALKSLPGNELSDPDRTVAAWIYYQCGDVSKAATLTRKTALRNFDLVQDPIFLGLSFPRPFYDLAQKSSNVFNVPISLIYAIMREESSFDTMATSPRKAFGLMQMIPETASRMAQGLNIRGFRGASLYLPQVGIPLGTKYLSDLLKRFRGNIPAVIASYHAGEGNVSRWLKRQKERTLDAFIEDIPFASTKDYVRHVFGAYGVYKSLYNEQSDPEVNLYSDL